MARRLARELPDGAVGGAGPTARRQPNSASIEFTSARAGPKSAGPKTQRRRTGPRAAGGPISTIGYQASHEPFPPGALLEYVQAAERAAFTAAMCSDHVAPWSERQGHSGFAWSWLRAALQATSLPIGVVTAPGGRYHPAIFAQPAATLAEMFSDRFWVALGSGPDLSEHITGQRWPPKPERNSRLNESVDLIRALWSGRTVTHYGRVRLDDAKLWSRPERPPLIIGPALSEETPEFVGGWADGLITVNARAPRLH